MSPIENKVEWCIKKALKEIAEGRKHRGLRKIEVDITEIRKHIIKAEHNLGAISYFSKGGFSDWSMSACFYCIYHCFLAIIVKDIIISPVRCLLLDSKGAKKWGNKSVLCYTLKFGYESRNQECTIALIKALKQEGKIQLDEKFIQALDAYNDSERHETNVIEEREKYTYGTSVGVDNKEEIEESIALCKECLNETKKILFNNE